TPRGTTPLPLHNGQAWPSWASIALRMNSLLFGSLSRSLASSASTLKATTSVFWGRLFTVHLLCGRDSRPPLQCRRLPGESQAWEAGRRRPDRGHDEPAQDSSRAGEQPFKVIAARLARESRGARRSKRRAEAADPELGGGNFFWWGRHSCLPNRTA